MSRKCSVCRKPGHNKATCQAERHAPRRPRGTVTLMVNYYGKNNKIPVYYHIKNKNIFFYELCKRG